MSNLTDYFAAPTDGVAATAAEYTEGRPGLLDLTPQDVAAGKALYRQNPVLGAMPRVRTAASGTLVVQSKNVEPALSMAQLEEILTGRMRRVIKDDPRWAALIGPARPEDVAGAGVVSLTDSLRDALAGLDAPAIREAARRWGEAEEFADADTSGLAPFLTALADLAARALTGGEHLYCRVVF
ncbi:hypothetical protein [Actinoplanes flavus]|uniref:Uncharacterized protein n=1 Tax=Actinoplanes flavus TaxID=2820290 RepID=A0ABS3UFE0_9ACTN|nr:hypothetical protein [Actinoplanes flavus]MBO3737485.1 hypothetical protein [Actinoplanes flavus]